MKHAPQPSVRPLRILYNFGFDSIISMVHDMHSFELLLKFQKIVLDYVMFIFFYMSTEKPRYPANKAFNLWSLEAGSQLIKDCY